MAAAALDADLATNVKKALKRGPAQPMFFAFVMKGGAGGKLIVSKAKIPPPQIAAAKKETGGSAVLKGVCFGEAGTLVFEMARPVAANVVAATKNLLKAKAGLTLKVEYRVGRDEETTPESAEPEEPSAEAGGDPAAAWKARLAEWTPAIKAALAAKGPRAADIGKLLAQATALSKPGGDIAQALEKLTECHALAAAGGAPPPPPSADAAKAAVLKRLNGLTGAIKVALAGPNAARVQALFGAINGLLRNNDFAQAAKVLDELEPLAGTGAAPPPPPAAPPPPDAAKAAVMKRLSRLTGAVRAALAGPNAARVQALFGAINGLLKNNDFAQAAKVLDELEPLLVPAAAPPPPPPQPPGATKAAVVKRLNGIAAALKAALAGPNGARVKALSVAVNGFVKNNDFAQAAKVLDELEPLLAAPAAAPVSLVRLQQCRLAWGAAVKKLQGGLDKLSQATRQAYAGDPRLAQIEVAINTIIANLRGHYEDLSDKLDEALNAEAPEQRQQRHREARARVQQFLAYVAGDPVLQQIDDNGLVPLEIKKTLSAALPVLASKLGA
jgi:protein-arginine kinase activator protein McsA